MNSRIAQAVREHHVITFWYDGLVRTVEPHTYGITTADHEALAGWQMAGFSRSGELPGWRVYLTNKMSGFAVTEDTFSGPRPGYNPDDSRFREIWARV